MTEQEQKVIYEDQGSIRNTSIVIAERYAQLSSGKTIHLDEFCEAFVPILKQRVEIYNSFNIENGNLLIRGVERSLMDIYSFFQHMEDAVNEGFDENLPVDYDIDLPTMILYTMILESKIVREWFASFRKSTLIEALSELYKQSVKACPYQTLFSEQNFVDENLFKVKIFLRKIDPALMPRIIASGM